MKFGLSFFLTIAVLLAFSPPAHAYVDPGTGSYMVQVALGGLLAAAFSIKLFWQRVKVYFTGLFHRPPASAPAPKTPPDERD